MFIKISNILNQISYIIYQISNKTYKISYLPNYIRYLIHYMRYLIYFTKKIKTPLTSSSSSNKSYLLKLEAEMLSAILMGEKLLFVISLHII